MALEFPAFLMHKSGYDLDLVDSLRCWSAKEVRPSGFANSICEMRQAIRQELRNKNQKHFGFETEIFSLFYDKK
jgi:hypothetical protein